MKLIPLASCRLLLILLCWSAFAGSLRADDWTSIRGNDGMGRWVGKTRLTEARNVGLKVRWKKRIGSGYSSVVVSQEKAITMYTDGEQDRVICLNVKDGQTIWNEVLEPIFKGSNGSFDGPIATPVIWKEHVFCLSARGKLHALELATGKRIWVRDLVAEENAAVPMYGFSTTPLVHGETLCVLAGAEGGALIGLDVRTGATKWRSGKGSIASQIPTLIDINGRKVVVTGAGRNVLGVDPDNGELLFEFPHQGSNGSAMMPVPFGTNQLLLTNDDSFSRAFEIKPAAEGYDVSESWTDRSIKNSYNIPVNSDGHLFAYSTRILTCVDEITGQPRWKSRKPGDGFLIEVDQHLVIVTKQGSVHIARTNPRQYDEVAAIDVFENLVWAVPAYSNNAIFVRSLNEIACIDITDRSDAVVANDSSSLPMSPMFREFLSRVEKAESDEAKQELVNGFLAEHPKAPIVADGVAHFVFAGEAQDMALASDVFGARQEVKMVRLPGTNLFCYTLRLPSDQRVSYVLLRDFKPQTDPRNPRKMISSMYAGEMEFAVRLRNEKPLEMSWFGMSDWKAPPWLDLHRPVGMAGKMMEEEFDLGDQGSLDATVYLPPEYDQKKDARYPVIYVPDGDSALQLGKLEETADLYFRFRPERSAILVFIRSQPTAGLPAFLKQIVEHVVPAVDKRYRTQAKRTARACFGAGFASSLSLALAAQYPDVFGVCSVQSPLVFDQARKTAIDGFKRIDRPMRLHIEWGRYDMHNPVENWDIREMAKTMKNEIEANPQVTILGGEVNDSTDWASWKNRFDQVVAGLFD